MFVFAFTNEMESYHQQIQNELVKIARLNDDAVLRWALRSSTDESELIRNLLDTTSEQVHALSRTLLVQPDRQQKVSPLIPCQSEPSESSSFVLLPVDVGPLEGSTTVCLSRAFQVKTTSFSDNILNDLSLIAAVVFYNKALFFHQQAELENDHNTSAVISRYYKISNSILMETNGRMKPTRMIWSFQAAVLYNLADCDRSPCNFALLEELLPKLHDSGENSFFRRAIAVAKMQFVTCCSATA